MKWQKSLKILILLLSFAAFSNEAFAGSGGYLVRGLGRTLGSVFLIPRAMLIHSQQVMFPFGFATGAVQGTFQTISQLSAGVIDLATGAAPYAKYMVFFI